MSKTNVLVLNVYIDLSYLRVFCCLKSVSAISMYTDFSLPILDV